MHDTPVVPARTARSSAASSLRTHRDFRKGDGSRRGADEGQRVPPLPHELQGRVRLGEPLPIRFETGVGEAAVFVGGDLEQNPIMGVRGRGRDCHRLRNEPSDGDATLHKVQQRTTIVSHLMQLEGGWFAAMAGVTWQVQTAYCSLNRTVGL